MKKSATLLFLTVFTLLCCAALAQPVNTYRSFTWDGWPVNSLSQTNFYSNLGPDHVNVSLSFSFSGTASASTASVNTYANQSGRISSLKVDKSNSQETLTAVLNFNKNLEGFNLGINMFGSDYVIVDARDIANNPVNVAGAYDIGYTDPVSRTGNKLNAAGNADINIFFAGPVAKVTFTVYKATAPTSKMEFAIGAVSWFNSSAYTHNPDMAPKCEGNNILMILDASTSIDATERTQLINAVDAMLDDLKYYSTTPNYISFVEFSTQARLALDYTMITPASIAPGGAIYTYLHNTDGNGYYKNNSLYGGHTNWSNAFKVTLAKARVQSPNLLIFFTDGAPNKIFEPNVEVNSNLLYSAAWGVNRTSLYADTIKQMGTHILGVGTDRINTQNRDFYFRYAIEMSNPVIYDYSVPAPSNISTADYVTVPAFSDLTSVLGNLFSTCNLLLPVQFTGLKAQSVTCGNNHLSWSVENEKQILSYEVQRSTDAIHFEAIGTVQASADGGAKTYQFDDHSVNAKTVYYRIKAVGYEGDRDYSEVAMVQTNCQQNLINVYPNPVNSGNQTVQIINEYRGQVNLVINDMAGRMVMAKSIQKTQDVLVIQNDLSRFSKGVYHMSLTDQQHNILAMSKILKQ